MSSVDHHPALAALWTALSAALSVAVSPVAVARIQEPEADEPPSLESATEVDVDPNTERAASESRYSGSLAFLFENDTFAGTDNNFTTGWSFTWTSREVSELGEGSFWRKNVKFWSFLPVVGNEGTRNYITYALGQSFATATNIEDPQPPFDDQPYAGLLAAATGVHGRTERAMHNWWLIAGMVGPSSRAEEVQTKVHEVIDSALPQGWDTQLEDEFIVNVLYDWNYRVSSWRLSEAWALDITTNTGAGAGNAWAGAFGGGFARVGFNLPDNFGPRMPRFGLGSAPINLQPPSKRWQVYLFLGADVQYVARNLFLDGNTWKDSRSVDKEPWVGLLSWGLGFQKGPFVLNWSNFRQTDTYETQRVNNAFGAITLSVYF